jgi:hypothetical protein
VDIYTRPKNRLFHYCKLSTLIELILPEMSLLLSPLEKTNDPRENQSFVFGAISNGSIALDEIKTKNDEVSKLLRENVKLICFSDDVYNTTHDTKSIFGYELSAMWAHYAERHQGVCIELDKEKFLFENKDRIIKENLRKIKYIPLENNIQPIYLDYGELESDSLQKEQYLSNFKHQHKEHLYFTKYKEWEHENEVRLLHFSDKNENEYCTIKESLVNIYLGIEFKDQYLPSIKTFAPNVGLAKLEYTNGRLRPKYDYDI